MLNIDEDFKKFFPNVNFELKNIQKQSVANVVENGNTLCIMPTGGGKSIIYWLAGLELGGTTLVISPLTALISEQSKKLVEHGYDARIFHSDINPSKQMEILIDFANGRISPDFIFVSPEKIATDGLFEYCMKSRRSDIKLVVIDEVHCVSQWGISFRPMYKRIPDFMNNLFGDNWSKVLALTATLNPKEREDICADFRISTENVVIDKFIVRNDINIHVKKFDSENDKEFAFWEIIEKHRGDKTLVYLYRKKGDRGVEGLYSTAREKGYNAEMFHGDMSANARMKIIERYKNNEIDILFATNAFGMGIDISDIRAVIHFTIPESAEQFYQEIGRAGRDSNGADSYLLYSDKNIEVKRTYFIEHSFPDEKKLSDTYKKIVRRIGYQALDYFENEDIPYCLSYYLACGSIEIVCKGFPDFGNLYDIRDVALQNYYDSTLTKNFVTTLKKNSISPEQLTDKVYKSLVNGDAKLAKPLQRWLIINIFDAEISSANLEKISADINEKKSYKNALLDYFVGLLERYAMDSDKLHEGIANYLGKNQYEA